jgi:Homeodomain-like domain
MSSPATKHKVVLTDDQHAELHRLLRQTSIGVARKRWATILLLANEAHSDGRKTDEVIAADVGISLRHLGRLRKKFVAHGFDATLARSTRSDAGVPKVLDGPAEAHLVALCCTTPPDGRDHWTLQLLCDELARLRVVTSVCPETVRQCLKKTTSGRGRPNGSASPRTTDRDSSPPWKRCSTSTNAPTTRGTR